MSEYYVHPTSVIDERVFIGEDTKIWHFILQAAVLLLLSVWNRTLIDFLKRLFAS